jgi:hypothetical protein
MVGVQEGMSHGDYAPLSAAPAREASGMGVEVAVLLAAHAAESSRIFMFSG